jgi:hypothetical protein
MNNNTLIDMLEEIIRDIRNDKYQIKYTTYLASILQKFLFIKDINQNPPSNKDVFDFLSLGWYIYNNLETN